MDITEIIRSIECVIDSMEKQLRALRSTVSYLKRFAS